MYCVRLLSGEDLGRHRHTAAARQMLASKAAVLALVTLQSKGSCPLVAVAPFLSILLQRASREATRVITSDLPYFIFIMS